MTIKERMVRRSPEDVVYIGDLVERHFQGEFGEVLEALTNGRVQEEALRERGQLSADRILGRIEMAARLAQDLEQFIIDKDSMMEPKKRTPEGKESPLADEVATPEPEVLQYGGIV